MVQMTCSQHIKYDPVVPVPAENATETARQRISRPRGMYKKEGITMLKRIPHILLLGFMLLVLSAHTQAEQSPKQTVQTAVETILGILTNETLDKEQKRVKMRETINERFDFLSLHIIYIN